VREKAKGWVAKGVQAGGSLPHAEHADVQPVRIASALNPYHQRPPTDIDKSDIAMLW
jgi:hypothetical protein